VAKYGISQEGIDALNQLASDMMNINNNIEQSGRTLKGQVSGLSDGLGLYEDEIIELVDEVNNAQEKGRESLIKLSTKAKELANQVSELLNAGLG
jgi:phage I-like protein